MVLSDVNDEINNARKIPSLRMLGARHVPKWPVKSFLRQYCLQELGQVHVWLDPEIHQSQWDAEVFVLPSLDWAICHPLHLELSRQLSPQVLCRRWINRRCELQANKEGQEWNRKAGNRTNECYIEEIAILGDVLIRFRKLKYGNPIDGRIVGVDNFTW